MADSSSKQESYSLPVTVSGSGVTNFKIKGDEYQVCAMRPSPSASVHELKISLDRNREMLEQSAKAMYKLKPGKGKVDDLLSPTRNALLARANIDMLIPLINIKGGEAAYEGINEALLIEKHVDKLRNDAAKKIEKFITPTPLEILLSNPLTLIMLVVTLTMVFLYLLFKFVFN